MLVSLLFKVPAMYKITFFIIFLFFQSFSVKAQNTLTLLSQLPMPDPCYDVWGYVDTLTGKEYALAGCGGLTIVDVTDPVNPFQVANIDTIPYFDLKAWKNYVYTVTGNSLDTGYIVDIANPANPVVVNTFPTSHNIFIDKKGYLYAEYPGLKIYDLNPDPTVPMLIWSGGTQGHDAVVIDSLLFDFHGWAGVTNIYNISDPSNPALLGSITDTAIQYHHQGWPSKDGNYLYICDELAEAPRPDITIWDISNPDSAVKVGSFSDSLATVHNLYVIGDSAYVSYYSAGLRVLDLTNPTSPTIAYEYDTSPISEEGFSGAFGVYPFALNNKIFVTDRDNMLFIFGFSDTLTGIAAGDNLGMVSLNIYPNPNYGKFILTIYDKKNQQNGGVHLFRILSITGQLLYEEEIKQISGNFIKKFDLSSWQQGIYILNLETEKDVIYGKLQLLNK